MHRFYFICLLCLLAGFVHGQSRVQQTLTWSPSIAFSGNFDEQYDYYDNSTDILIGVKLDYSVGYKLNQYLTLGISTGLRHFIVPDYISIDGNDHWVDDDLESFKSFFKLPIAANLNIRFIDKKVSPYLGLAGGYMFGLNSKNEDNAGLAQDAVFGNVGAGVSIRFKNGKAFQVGPIVEYISLEKYNSTVSPSSFSSSKDMWQVGVNASFAF